jgi:phosphoglycolate/pyridoxal phosphate phosphatase family enzyme
LYNSRVILLERYDVFLFDLDGVLYRGDEAIPSAAEVIAAMRSAGKGVAFVTNNASATPDDVVGRLERVGIGAQASEVETSALTTAALLAHRGTQHVVVIGEAGLLEALAGAGVRATHARDVTDGPDAEVAEAVVVGLDRTADYAALRAACLQVDAGAPLVATNPDTSFPAPGGHRWPGAGALLAAIQATTGATAEVVGKPNAPIFEAALARAGGGRPLMVGDRLDTDIEGAARLGWDSLLVLTGIDGREQALEAPHPPTYIGQDLSCLVEPGFA